MSPVMSSFRTELDERLRAEHRAHAATIGHEPRPTLADVLLGGMRARRRYTLTDEGHRALEGGRR